MKPIHRVVALVLAVLIVLSTLSVLIYSMVS